MNENSLLVSHVPRTLETKSKIFGFELGDVLILFLNLSVQNLVFGESSFKYPMVYGGTALLGFILFFVKRGKPDSYLQHLSQYMISPTVLYAGKVDQKFKPIQKIEGNLC